MKTEELLDKLKNKSCTLCDGKGGFYRCGERCKGKVFSRVVFDKCRRCRGSGRKAWIVAVPGSDGKMLYV